MMIDIDSMKKPATRARATFLFSTTSFQRLCRGVAFSMIQKTITRMAIPSTEYSTELSRYCVCMIELFIICDTPDHCCSRFVSYRRN